MLGIGSVQTTRVFARLAALVPAAMVACLSLVLGGCVTAFDQHRAALRTLHEQGQYAQAAMLMDGPETRGLYSNNDKLLLWLDRGSVALALDDAPRAVDELEKAEGYTETKRELTGGEEATRWILNDTAVPYVGEPYEELYINVFKMLAQLEAGRIEDGAAIEARRMAGKADVLRDRYVRTLDAASKKADARTRSGLTGPYENTTAGGEFIESTLGTYLTAITAMKVGDSQSQAVAARRLASGLDLQKTLAPGVDASRFQQLGDLRASDVNVLVVGLSGRGPYKIARTIGPIPVFEWPVYFQLPELTGGSEQVSAVRVIVETDQGGGEAPRTLDKVEDLRAVATENHRRQLPVIYARTLIRSQLKAAASFAATEAVKSSAGRSRGNRDLAAVGMTLAGLALIAATEKADLRCWTFLPGRADVGAFKLPPGTHRVRVEFLSALGGVVYSSAPRTITLSNEPRQLVTLVEHYWQ